MRITYHVRPHHDVAQRVKARGIGDFFGFGDNDSTTTTKGTTTSATTTSTSSETTTTTSATSATSTTVTSATSTDTSTSATSTSTSGTPTSTSSSTPTSTSSASTSSTLTNAPPTPTPPPVQQPPSTSVFMSSSDGKIIRVTTVVFASDTNAVSNTASSSAASATSSHKATPFLQNKAASGVVFTLVAIISLVVIVSIATTAIRKSRKNKLERDALEDGGINWPSPDASAPAAAPGNIRHSTEKAAWNDTGSVYSQGGAPAAGAGYGSDHGHGAPAVVPPARTMTPGIPPSMQYIQPQHTGYAPSQPPSSHGHGYYTGPDEYAYGPPGVQQYPTMNNPYAVGYAPGSPVTFPAGADGGYAVGGAPQLPPPTLTVNTTSVPMRRTSLMNANQPNSKSPEDPTSPTSSWENHSNSTHGTTSDRVQRRISHSRGLDPMLPPLPRSPALPETFGTRESADEKPLRVANQ